MISKVTEAVPMPIQKMNYLAPTKIQMKINGWKSQVMKIQQIDNC